MATTQRPRRPRKKAASAPVPAPAPEPAEPSRSVEEPDVGAVETKEQPRPVNPAGSREGVPDGLIIGPDEPLTLEGDEDGPVIVVSRAVYRKIIPFNAQRPTYVLLYPRGARVPKTLLTPKE